MIVYGRGKGLKETLLGSVKVEAGRGGGNYHPSLTLTATKTI